MRSRFTRTIRWLAIPLICMLTVSLATAGPARAATFVPLLGDGSSWAEPACHWAGIDTWAPPADCRLPGPCPSDGFPCEWGRAAVPYHCPFEAGGAAGFAHPYAGGPFPPGPVGTPQQPPELILPDALPGAGGPNPGRLPAPTPPLPAGDAAEPPAMEVPPNAPVAPRSEPGRDPGR